MLLSPSLKKSLLNAAENLSIVYEKNQLNIAQKQKMLGLGAVVAGLPACAIGGLKYALPVVGFGLYLLFKARQNENKAFTAAKFHHALNPSYVPKMNYPKPRPW